MRAVVYRKPFEVAVEDVPEPKLEHPNDVLVRITSSCICGSDLHMYEGRTAAEPGIVFGHENLGVIAHRSNTRQDGTAIAASRLDNDASSGGRRPLGGTVPRAPVDHDDFAHILLQHRGDDMADCRFLVEAGNDRRDDGHLVHRLQRSPQLAQLSGGLSESSAARKSRYASPFQISRKDCCPA